MKKYSINAQPYEFEGDISKTALVIIDMQRDFVMPGGFGEALGNNVTPLQATIKPIGNLLAKARELSMLVIHTREGHRPDLGDCPPSKLKRGRGEKTIGDVCSMGRLLVRGEYGQDIIPELYPIAGEVVLDKPGKGAFFATDLDHILHNKGIEFLIVCGVTTEVCVNTTVREANDRGFECLIPEDCVGSYFPEFQKYALEMIKAQGGIFGWVSDSKAVLEAWK